MRLFHRIFPVNLLFVILFAQSAWSQLDSASVGIDTTSTEITDSILTNPVIEAKSLCESRTFDQISAPDLSLPVQSPFQTVWQSGGNRIEASKFTTAIGPKEVNIEMPAVVLKGLKM